MTLAGISWLERLLHLFDPQYPQWQNEGVTLVKIKFLSILKVLCWVLVQGEKVRGLVELRVVCTYIYYQI